ncbi:tripartite tricarboxylate transporter permease [Natronosalvus caseinilyticus]|uniref:tripartite tricarboxylate transporter permease n=1 Tax=Natronosalvus caseinilyticus TaxID=2953747 RepID=UPI0028A7780D|nr:tripartite tricarboxylate transporter permease [Natronosalvus caseinilyticus]
MGFCFGVILGAIPGVGTAVGMALVLPLTIFVDGTTAVILLTCIYMGGMYGGSISAILLNVPGTAGSAATTFDGYPMSRKGQAVTALSISAASSAIGGLISVIILFLITPFIIELVLLFNSPDLFLVALLGLAMITVVSRGSMVKGLTIGMFGLLFSTVGVSPTAPDVRYNFDSVLLYDGLNIVAALLGLFAISEMIKLAAERGGIAKSDTELSGSVAEGIAFTIYHPWYVIKSSLIGTIIGALPGAGSSMANFVAYSEAMRSSGMADSFGKGDKRGVLASEASNNSAVGGALIPTLSFGIPGSASTAILLGGFLMHGLNPGPSLFGSNLNITFSIYLAVAIGVIVLIPLLGLLVITQLGHLTKVNTDYIIPIIVVLSMAGIYTSNISWIDVLTVFLLGIGGYYMRKYDFSIVAFLLGAILGRMAEENLFRSLQISGGSYEIFVESPLSIAIIVITLLIVLSPQLQKIRGLA